MKSATIRLAIGVALLISAPLVVSAFCAFTPSFLQYAIFMVAGMAGIVVGFFIVELMLCHDIDSFFDNTTNMKSLSLNLMIPASIITSGLLYRLTEPDYSITGTVVSPYLLHLVISFAISSIVASVDNNSRDDEGWKSCKANIRKITDNTVVLDNGTKLPLEDVFGEPLASSLRERSQLDANNEYAVRYKARISEAGAVEYRKISVTVRAVKSSK